MVTNWNLNKNLEKKNKKWQLKDVTNLLKVTQPAEVQLTPQC